MEKGHTKKNISNKVKEDLRKLEMEISNDLGKPTFDPLTRIKARYSMYYSFPKQMNQQIRERLDNILERYGIPLPYDKEENKEE